MSNHLGWYVARSSGLVAYFLVAASVVWGLLLSVRPAARPRPAWTLDLHRFLGGLSVVFTGIHIAGVALDGTVHLGLAALLVPGSSWWRPGPLAWGIVAMYLLVAVEMTSLAMRRLPRKWWRRVHLTSFALFVLTTVHGLSAGSDTRNPVLDWSALTAGAAVLFLVVVRVAAPRRAAGRARANPPALAGHLTGRSSSVESRGFPRHPAGANVSRRGADLAVRAPRR